MLGDAPITVQDSTYAKPLQKIFQALWYLRQTPTTHPTVAAGWVMF